MKRYIPNQHGAWAMLTVPFLFGMVAGEPGRLHMLLFLCWLLSYLLAFQLLQWTRTGKGERFRGPVLAYGVPFVLLGIWMVLLKPWLLGYGLVLLPLFAVNRRFARHNRERSLWNDMTAILQFSSIVFPAYYVGGGTDWGLAAGLFLISCLYFGGTVLYVKTLIRERGDPVYYYSSVGYHLMLLAVSAALRMPFLSLLACILSVRAVWFPKTRLTVKQSGMLEIGCSVLVAVLVMAERI